MRPEGLHYKRQPDKDKDITVWNQEGKKFALKVKEEVIDDLWKDDKKIAEQFKIKPPKRSASETETVAGRYDKLAEKRKVLLDNTLKSQMSPFLMQRPAESSSSSSSSSWSSLMVCRVNQNLL